MNLDKFVDGLLSEESTKDIKVEHPGILEVPEGKHFSDLPISHYKDLMKKKGNAPVMRALLNLERWNKEKNPSVAAKARKIIDSVKEE